MDSNNNSNDYTQHTFISWKLDQNIISIMPLDLVLQYINSHYHYLKQTYMVPKVFEPLKFGCISRMRMAKLILRSKIYCILFLKSMLLTAICCCCLINRILLKIDKNKKNLIIFFIL